MTNFQRTQEVQADLIQDHSHIRHSWLVEQAFCCIFSSDTDFFCELLSGRLGNFQWLTDLQDWGLTNASVLLPCWWLLCLLTEAGTSQPEAKGPLKAGHYSCRVAKNHKTFSITIFSLLIFFSLRLSSSLMIGILNFPVITGMPE